MFAHANWKIEFIAVKGDKCSELIFSDEFCDIMRPEARASDAKFETLQRKTLNYFVHETKMDFSVLTSRWTREASGESGHQAANLSLRICNLLRLPRRGRSFEGPKCSIDSCPNLKPPAARRSAAGCLRSAVQACVLVQYKLSPSISPKPIPPKAPSKENSKERDGTMPSSPPSSSNAIVLRGRFVLAAISSRLRAA
jgi:hypothetical protein